MAVGASFGLAVAVLITLVGPLLLFNPWFTSALQARHDVASSFDTDQAEIDRVTGQILVDLYLDGPFDATLGPGVPLLDAEERSHMHDVSVLVRILAGVTVLAAVIAVATGLMLRAERARRGRILLIAGGTIGAVAVLLAGTFAVAFEAAFLSFHQVFFPPGTYLFPEGSNLIGLFPEAFWFDAALAAGAAIIVTAVVVSLIGLTRWRAGRVRPAA